MSGWNGWISVGVYPGLVWVGLLVAIVSWMQGDSLGNFRTLGQALRQPQTPWSWLAAVAIGGCAVALLPWPMATVRPWQWNLWLVWTANEALHLLALLPLWTSADTATNSTVVREAQLTTLGRVALWLGVGTALASGAANLALPRLAATFAAIVALPWALNWPPWGRGTLSPRPDAVPRAQRPLVALVSALRSTALLALVATFCVAAPTGVWWQTLLAQLAMIVGLAAIGRGLQGIVVQQRLDIGLRQAWRVAVPLGLIAVVWLWLAG